MTDRYMLARDLAESGDIEGSWKVVMSFLLDNPNDARALVTASFLMRKCGRLPEAYHFAKAATNICAWDAAPWVNLGHAASELWRPEESEEAYRKALSCRNINEGTIKRNTLLNISALYIDNGRFEDARKIAEEMLRLYPGDINGTANLGFCQLAAREWVPGWENYRKTLGSDWRPRTQFRDEDEWDGTPGKTVVIYGEQGLGDEISFASVLPDAEKVCKRVILECDPKLEGLFRRSFPNIKVYGTRRAKDGSQKWDKADWNFDASFPVGQLGEYFRKRDEDFPVTPYLTPCPQRVAMWKSYFATLGKPVIGIAWRGGIPRTNAKNRQLMLDDLLPVLKMDCHFVSLQYKDARGEIAGFKKRHSDVDIVQYPWATLTPDYDDTAALIAACDYVVCMQTAVAHTAGALGVPVSVLVPAASQWRYGSTAESLPWYRSLKVVRQKQHGSWGTEISRAAEQLAAHLGIVPPAAGESARDGDIRPGTFTIICPDGGASDREDGGDAPTGLRMREPVQSRQVA